MEAPWRLVKIKDKVEEAYGMNLKLEDLRRVIKIFDEEWKWLLIICEFPVAFGEQLLVLCTVNAHLPC